jgi:hypothetical protein
MDVEQASIVERRIEARDRALTDQAHIGAAARVLCEHWLQTLTAIEMNGQLGAPDWKGYELRIWRLGESLRLFLRTKKGWRGPGVLLDAVAAVLRDRRFGKGRQTFALLLGDFGGQAYGEQLASVLDDREVWGHAIKALTKAKIPHYAAEVAAVQTQETGWIRAAARKYLQLLAGWPHIAPHA